MENKKLNIVIFCCDTPYAAKALDLFLDKYAIYVKGIVTIQENNFSLFRRIIKVSKRAGWEYAFLKLFLFGTIKILQSIHSIFRFLPNSYPSLEFLCSRYHIKHYKFSSFNKDEIKDLLIDLQTDIIFSVFFNKIFDKTILSIPKKATLNLHPALLPLYSGCAPTFWALSHGESSSGVTLHYVDDGIDTGDILLQEETPIYKYDSVHSLYMRLSIHGAHLLILSVDNALNNYWQNISQNKAKRFYFYQPTKEGYKNLKKNGFKLFYISDIFLQKI